MLAMKNLVPLYFDKYDLLVRQHTQNLSDTEVSDAINMAKAPVANFLSTRLSIFPPLCIPAHLAVPGLNPSEQDFSCTLTFNQKRTHKHATLVYLTLPRDLVALSMLWMHMD